MGTIEKPSVDTILAKYPNAKRDALIPLLQDVQDEFGYLPKDVVATIGEHLSLPTSKIYGVATFYNQFRFEPLGKYHVQICRGTACHVKGSSAVLEALKQELDINAGQTTRDGLFSIEVVACIGACGLAPVISINGEFYAAVTADGARKIVAEYRKAASDDNSDQ